MLLGRMEFPLPPNNEPRAQLNEHMEGREFVVSHVFFVDGLDVFLIDVCGNLHNANLVNNLLVNVVFPNGQMLLLEFEEVSPFGIILDRQVDKVGISNTALVEVILLDDDAHFVLVKNERGYICATPTHDVVGKLLMQSASSSLII